MGVIVADSEGGCDWLLKFTVQVFIIILTRFYPVLCTGNLLTMKKKNQ